MDSRAQALKADGAVVLVDDEPETGVVGYTVLPTAARAVGAKLTHCLYNRPLKPEIRLVQTANEFAVWLRDHDGHPRFRANATRQKQIGMVCFCKASEGRSQVIRILVENTRHADPLLMAKILRAASL